MMADEGEIKDVMAEERSRGAGRKKIDSDARRKREQTKKDLARVPASGDEVEFMRILRGIGVKDGTPEFANALKSFRAARGGRETQLYEFRLFSCPHPREA